jgi:exopolysaccharide biosynthesis polyprenyl glycosylphosphotransferase
MSSIDRISVVPRLEAHAFRRLRLDNVWSLAPLIDGVVLLLAVFVERIGARAAAATPLPLGWLLLFPPITLALLAAAGTYRLRLRVHILDDLRTIGGATAIAAMTTITMSVLVAGPANLAVQGVRLWLFSTVYLAASRIGIVAAAAASRRDGASGAPTLIVGAGDVGRLLAKRLVDHPEMGLRPIGFLDKEPRALDPDDPSTPRLPVLGASWDLEDVLEQYRVERVVFTFSTAPHDVLMRMVDQCTSRGVHVTVVPRLFEKMPRNTTVDYLGGIPLVSIHPTDPRGSSFKLKYHLDRLVASVAVVLLAPLLAGIAAAIRITLGRPILFRQLRVGRDGEVFEMLKFRSMRETPRTASVAVELADDVAPGGIEGADRVTRLGAFLRRSSLDELPQLVNVILGEMSLVGPRPERPEFVERFELDVHRYGERHRVKAGMTGWAQVHGLRGNTSLSERAEWDNYYIENASLWLDLKIMLMTLVAMLRPANAAVPQTSPKSEYTIRRVSPSISSATSSNTR